MWPSWPSAGFDANAETCEQEVINKEKNINQGASGVALGNAAGVQNDGSS
jgi:hypothetical protein